jgi:hypothetical protein
VLIVSSSLVPAPAETQSEDDEGQKGASGEPSPRDASFTSVPRSDRVLLISVGTDSTMVVQPAREDDRSVLRVVRHGPVALAASQAAAAKGSAGAIARVIRSAAKQVVERAHFPDPPPVADFVLGSGAAGAVIALGADGQRRATVEQVRNATDSLAAAWIAAAKDRRPRGVVQSMMIGSAVLGEILEALRAGEIAVDVHATRTAPLDDA